MQLILLSLGLLAIGLALYFLREDYREYRRRQFERNRKTSRIRSLLPPIHVWVVSALSSGGTLIIRETAFDWVFSSFNSWITRQFDTETQAHWVSSTAALFVDYDLFEWVATGITFVVGLVIFAALHRKWFRVDQTSKQQNERESRVRWENIAIPGIVGIIAVVMASIGMAKKNDPKD